MSAPTAPLCDAGRCAQVMAHLARVRDGFVERQAGRLTQVIQTVLRRYGVDVTDAEVAAAVAAEIEAITGSTTIEGVAK